MKMYYRITSFSPLSNFKQRRVPNQFYTHQDYLFFAHNFFTYPHCYLEVKLNYASYLQVIPFFFQ